MTNKICKAYVSIDCSRYTSHCATLRIINKIKFLNWKSINITIKAPTCIISRVTPIIIFNFEKLISLCNISQINDSIEYAVHSLFGVQSPVN